MPDDGAWLNGPGYPLGGGTRTARARFEEVLAEFTQRLAAPEPLRRETAVALVQQMQRLSGRMATDNDTLQGRATDLSTALAALNARLDTELAAAAAREARLTARLDQTLVELAEAQAAKRPLVGPGAVRLVLSAAALCAVLCGSVVGVTALNRPQPAMAPTPTMAVAVEEPAAQAQTFAIPAAPPPVRVEIPPAPPAVPTTQRTTDTFPTVSAALARGEPTAVRRLNALAQAGDARAQLQLASFYEAGESGLARDLSAARRWTLRAARGGDRAAMYNAAIFLMEGEGGPQDMQEAGIWFRRAAERGVTDAQYNLGLMYETGRGVERNPGEAQRWFALAAKAGDPTAAAKLSNVEPPPAPTAAAVDGPSVADTQRYLAQQGYYLGPIDGVVSPVLSAAAKAYVRDHPGSTPGL
jgi:localization factor PodJL